MVFKPATIDVLFYKCQEEETLNRIEEMHEYVDYFLLVEAEQ
jgi:hypothetical protein